MKKLIYILMACVVLSACEDEAYYPAGLYGYQVERLLTGGDIATWQITSMSIDGVDQDLSSCNDEIRWVFDQVDDDSIAFYSLTFDAECVFYDTLLMGELNASAELTEDDEELLFTDSLILDNTGTLNDRFMIVTEITSSNLRVIYTLSNKAYIARLKKVPSSRLVAQVSAILSGGTSIGSSATWQALSEQVGGISTSRLDTCTNAKQFRIELLADDALNVTQLVGDSNCNLNSTEFGEAIVANEDGYFAERIEFSGEVTNSFTFNALNDSLMDISYTIQDTLQVEAIYQKQ
ncbi:MAG: lipocalin family protein [Cyclobacteriaceae bacterium]